MRKKFTTTLDEGTVKKLKLIAIQENTNASKIIERLVLDYAKEKGVSLAPESTSKGGS